MDKQVNVLSELLTGNEIALLDVLLYLHDKQVIDKDDLAARLESTVARLTKIFDDSYPDNDRATVLFPSRRLAAALRLAVKLEDDE